MVLAGGYQRGEAHSGITTETEGGEDEALDEKWINPDEADDIAASKFLCGGGSWWQLDNKGGEDGLVWFGMVAGAGARYPGTSVPDHHRQTHGRCRRAGAYRVSCLRSLFRDLCDDGEGPLGFLSCLCVSTLTVPAF